MYVRNISFLFCYEYICVFLKTECISPKFLWWNLILSVIVLGSGASARSLDHEGRTLVSDNNVLIKETSKTSIAFPGMWRHSEKMDIYESGRKVSPDTKSAGALVLDTQLPEL